MRITDAARSSVYSNRRFALALKIRETARRSVLHRLSLDFTFPLCFIEHRSDNRRRALDFLLRIRIRIRVRSRSSTAPRRARTVVVSLEYFFLSSSRYGRPFPKHENISKRKGNNTAFAFFRATDPSRTTIFDKFFLTRTRVVCSDLSFGSAFFGTTVVFPFFSLSFFLSFEISFHSSFLCSSLPMYALKFHARARAHRPRYRDQPIRTSSGRDANENARIRRRLCFSFGFRSRQIAYARAFIPVTMIDLVEIVDKLEYSLFFHVVSSIVRVDRSVDTRVASNHAFPNLNSWRKRRAAYLTPFCVFVSRNPCDTSILPVSRGKTDCKETK